MSFIKIITNSPRCPFLCRLGADRTTPSRPHFAAIPSRPHLVPSCWTIPSPFPLAPLVLTSPSRTGPVAPSSRPSLWFSWTVPSRAILSRPAGSYIRYSINSSIWKIRYCLDISFSPNWCRKMFVPVQTFLSNQDQLEKNIYTDFFPLVQTAVTRGEMSSILADQ